MEDLLPLEVEIDEARVSSGFKLGECPTAYDTRPTIRGYLRDFYADISPRERDREHIIADVHRD